MLLHVHNLLVFTNFEHEQMVNVTHVNLLNLAIDQLRALGLAVAAQKEPRNAPDKRTDAWLRVGKGRHHVDYVAEVKRQVSPDTLGAVVTQLREMGKTAKRAPLLIAGHITPPMAGQLKAAGQQFVDGAGNAYLEGPGVFVLVTGRKPEATPTPGKFGRAFTTTGLKTLFALICDAALAAAPYREIANAAKVALGALPAVLGDLQQAGHLAVIGRKRRLIATRRLLDDWALAYARTLRPKQLMRTLVAPTPAFAEWQKWDLKPDNAKWGGEPAANLLTHYLKPGVLTIYAEKIPARLIVAQHLPTARAQDEYGLVEIRKPFWGETLRHDAKLETVAPALVYADLLATDDGRCIETAQVLYEEYLARLFPTA